MACVSALAAAPAACAAARMSSGSATVSRGTLQSGTASPSVGCA